MPYSSERKELNVVIVDDSRLARTELRRLLKKIEFVTIIGEAANADQAEDIIKSSDPDLILLDIQMPEKDGFELLEELDSVPYVIFVTAYDEYAVRAFEVNALDYLTKPVNPGRLVEALFKVKNSISETLGSNARLGEESRYL